MGPHGGHATPAERLVVLVNVPQPAGPAADVLTSQAAPSDPTMAPNAISVFICLAAPFRISTR